MKTASISGLKKELQEKSSEELIYFCTRLAKYNKDNKELLHYLLFEADDEGAYIRSVKEETEQSFIEMNQGSYYLVKKTVRRILKDLKKYIRYSGKKETELDLLIFFCQKLKTNPYLAEENPVMMNLYLRQLNNIHKILNSLHPDIQGDFEQQVADLSIAE